ncbi:MAG TPA: hypothetical protein VFB16_05080 [Bauldia sp.]|nr:hypothetical protein [Bauldia sp.]
MSGRFTRSARRLGLVSAIGAATLIALYAVTLVVGLASLASPNDAIADPMFTILEVLIIGLMPATVALIASLHAWAPEERKPHALVALVFMALVAVVTSAVHFCVLTLSRAEVFAGLPQVFAFRWPSVVYSLDILAWDIFFPVSVLFAATAISGSRLALWTRATLVASGVLSFAGLAGVVTGDMQLRNIGIVGYVPVFFVATILLAALFRGTAPAGNRPPE